MPVEVVMYTKSYCYYCVRAKTLLARHAIKYREVDVTHDEDMRDWLETKTGGRRKLPQIFIAGKPIGGCRELEELVRQGALKALVTG